MQEELIAYLIEAGFKKRKLAEFSIPALFSNQGFEPELLPFCDKPATAGILVFTNGTQSKAAHYELKRLKADKRGVLKPIICDFCYTLRPGTKIALVTFSLNREKTKTVAFYGCADLACSLHIRGLTNALDLAKTQVREDITIDGRIKRLLTKSQQIFDINGSIIIK